MSDGGVLTADRPVSVAVVIPAKNEAERIEATIRAARTIDRVDVVVVVDDGSTDATSAVAMGADALVVRHRSNLGKASAMATGAQVIALRDEAERADGGASYAEELHAEPRVPGHTGPLPVIGGADIPPRALLFLDADMGETAGGAAPLVDAVLDDGVDMAIALLPPQEGASGLGIVVRTARGGIRRATGFEAVQPLSGTRCITREAWDECQPLAAGWGVETSLTIDALSGGFWVKEIPCELQHRATGSDLRGQLHRAAQLRDVLRALARRRHIVPEVESGTGELPAPHREDPSRSVAEEERSAAAVVAAQEAVDSRTSTSTGPGTSTGTDLAEALSVLPVEEGFSPELAAALTDADVPLLDAQLRALPVSGPFRADDVVFLAGCDLDALRHRLESAPVDEPFEADHAVIIAAHLGAPAPRIPEDLRLPLEPAEYASLMVHTSVEAERDAAQTERESADDEQGDDRR